MSGIRIIDTTFTFNDSRVHYITANLPLLGTEILTLMGVRLENVLIITTTLKFDGPPAIDTLLCRGERGCKGKEEDVVVG